MTINNAILEVKERAVSFFWEIENKIKNHDVQITPETSTLSYVRFEYKQILQSTLSCFTLNMIFIFS